MLGIPGFSAQAGTILEDMKQEIGVFKRHDFGGIAVGVNLYQQAMTKWMSIVRDRYDGHIIHHMVNSLDSSGDHILGLEPYSEHIIVVELYPSEMAVLERVAMELEEMSETGMSSGKVCDISIRHLMMGRYTYDCN